MDVSQLQALIAPTMVWENITTSDVTEYEGIQALIVTGGGTISLTGFQRDGVTEEDITITASANNIIPISPLRINATGTSATGIIALFSPLYKQ